jgi:hypothetical protein
MRIVVVPEAADEFEDASFKYEKQEAGLGLRFREEVNRHIRWIAEHADLPRLRPGGYRRVNLKVFPYHVPYLRIGETVWVLAIAHAYREPEFWINRKESI